MHGTFRAARPAQHFVGAIGDDLVQVHVGLRAGTGLPDHKREMRIELPVHHLLRRRCDGIGDAGVQKPQILVGEGRGALDHGERADQRLRHDLAADFEIALGALGLGAPIALAGHLDGPECVGFGAGCAMVPEALFMRHRDASFSGHLRALGGLCNRRPYRLDNAIGYNIGQGREKRALPRAAVGRTLCGPGGGMRRACG